MLFRSVLKIRREALLAVNSLGEMMIASRHGDFPVKKGDKLAGTMHGVRISGTDLKKDLCTFILMKDSFFLLPHI